MNLNRGGSSVLSGENGGARGPRTEEQRPRQQGSQVGSRSAPSAKPQSAPSAKRQFIRAGGPRNASGTNHDQPPRKASGINQEDPGTKIQQASARQIQQVQARSPREQSGGLEFGGFPVASSEGSSSGGVQQFYGEEDPTPSGNANGFLDACCGRGSTGAQNQQSQFGGSSSSGRVERGRPRGRRMYGPAYADRIFYEDDIDESLFAPSSPRGRSGNRGAGGDRNQPSACPGAATIAKCPKKTVEFCGFVDPDRSSDEYEYVGGGGGAPYGYMESATSSGQQSYGAGAVPNEWSSAPTPGAWAASPRSFSSLAPPPLIFAPPPRVDSVRPLSTPSRSLSPRLEPPRGLFSPLPRTAATPPREAFFSPRTPGVPVGQASPRATTPTPSTPVFGTPRGPGPQSRSPSPRTGTPLKTLPIKGVGIGGGEVVSRGSPSASPRSVSSGARTTERRVIVTMVERQEPRRKPWSWLRKNGERGSGGGEDRGGPRARGEEKGPGETSTGTTFQPASGQEGTSGTTVQSML